MGKTNPLKSQPLKSFLTLFAKEFYKTLYYKTTSVRFFLPHGEIHKQKMNCFNTKFSITNRAPFNVLICLVLSYVT